MVELSEDFKGTMWETIFSEEYLTDEYFYKVSTSNTQDFEVNPIEDYFIVKLFLLDKSSEYIAKLLKRSLKCIQLRLRILLNSDGSTYSQYLADAKLKALFINKFHQKAVLYHEFCLERKWIWDVVEVFEHAFGDLNVNDEVTSNPLLNNLR